MSSRLLASSAQATAGRSAPFPPEAATISGDGVSPAASAAASGSPPGNAAATASAEAGRSAGSLSRQRRIARSVASSIPSTSRVGGNGLSCSRSLSISAVVLAVKAVLPVNSS